MRKKSIKAVFLGLVVLSLTFAGSCSKGTNAGGSWTFEGDTFVVTNCAGIGNALVASSSTYNNTSFFGNVSVLFPGSSLPSASGTYTVVDTAPSAGQVVVTASTGGVNDTLYTSTGFGTNQVVTVTVAHGVVTASGTGIELLYNSNGIIDSSAVSFKIYTAGKK